MNRAQATGAFGPWLRKRADAERRAQLRSLAALSAVFVGSHNPVVRELRLAERDDGALVSAYALFEQLPAIPKRRILATYGAVNDAGRDS
jgi:hypothetical protein